MHRWLESQWARKSYLAIILLPVSWLFRLIVSLRYRYYQFANRQRQQLPVPVIVVGNISVGGTGKTPLVIFLAHWLADNGYRPGIITRGYRGRSENWPIIVTADSDPQISGDEPVVIARATGCRVVAGPDRPVCAQYLLEQSNCNIILSDDGLQHYALMRDLEIVVIDGRRNFGNGYCLPAGPLREPVTRLLRTDFIIVNSGITMEGEFAMDIQPTQVNNLINPQEVRMLSSFKGGRVHAVAGIGNTERYFTMLVQSGLDIIKHEYPDHHGYTAEDINFDDELPVLMTEKDAVKCQSQVSGRHWQVCVEARLEQKFMDTLLTRIRSLKHG